MAALLLQVSKENDVEEQEEYIDLQPAYEIADVPAAAVSASSIQGMCVCCQAAGILHVHVIELCVHKYMYMYDQKHIMCVSYGANHTVYLDQTDCVPLFTRNSRKFCNYIRVPFLNEFWCRTHFSNTF